MFPIWGPMLPALALTCAPRIAAMDDWSWAAENSNDGIAGDADAAGKTFSRNVRTQPLEWSPIDNTTLFYAQNAVWKTKNGGTSWTRISGDLTRQTWDVPKNTGKYGASVTPSSLKISATPMP